MCCTFTKIKSLYNMFCILEHVSWRFTKPHLVDLVGLVQQFISQLSCYTDALVADYVFRCLAGNGAGSAAAAVLVVDLVL